ncbi:MAG: hypothetical protein ABFS02_07985 [Pseudomonadota bacterium]
MSKLIDEAVIEFGVGAASIQFSGDARVNLSVPHLSSAASFSRCVGELEAEHSGKEFGEFWRDIFANSTAAVFASIAALESYANELFIDHERVFPEIRIEVMAKLWELYEQKPPLEKFEFALLLKKGRNFEHGASPYQDVAALVKLRNGLIHFKPEWFSEQEEHTKLSSLLQYRAVLGPFFPKTEPLFPRGWASHATVAWAVRSVFDFIVEFEQRAQIGVRMGMFEDRFNIDPV